MRGKKTDNEFLSSFITQCVKKNINSSEQIAEAARQKVLEIDQKIKEVELLKVTRSKLLDVIATFDKPTKSDKNEEAKILSFFKIQNPLVCKFLCESIKNSTIKLGAFKESKHPQEDILFCIKQLIEHKVIHKTGDHLLRGDMYQEYMKFVLQES